MEALVSIVIIGLMSTLFFSFLSNSINKPLLINRAEALVLANKEIQITLSSRNFQDTSYSNNKSNLTLYKRVVESGNLYVVHVSVLYKNKTELINIPFEIKK